MTLVESAIAGALLGIAGSLHCAGMCGVFAIQAATQGKGFWRGFLPYWIGKSTTYLFLGVLAGQLGGALLRSAPSLQGYLGILTGGVILLAGIGTLRPPRGRSHGLVARLLAPLWSTLAELTRERGTFALGLASGALPCGLSGLAALQAAAQGQSIAALATMMGLALGTFPVLSVLASGARLGVERWGRVGVRGRLASALLLIGAGLFALWRAGQFLTSTGGTEGMPCCH